MYLYTYNINIVVLYVYHLAHLMQAWRGPAAKFPRPDKPGMVDDISKMIFRAVPFSIKPQEACKVFGDSQCRYDGWNELGNMSKDEAMKWYVEEYLPEIKEPKFKNYQAASNYNAANNYDPNKEIHLKE